MAIRGLLLSCLAHLVLIWMLLHLDWFRREAVPSDHASEPIFVTVFQPLAPVTQAPSTTPTETLAATPDQEVDRVVLSDQLPAPPRPELPASPPLQKPESSAGQVRALQTKPTEHAEAAPPPKPAPATQSKQVAKTAASRASSLPSSAPPPSDQSATPAPPASSATQPFRPSYAQRLTQRIEQHKSYPRRARERGLASEVRFSLSVDDSGQMMAFHWLEGHRAFRRATLQAVRRALPYPPDPGQAPVSVRIRMIYSLRDGNQP